MMQILDLLGIYFDAVVVFVTNSSLLFRLVMAILYFDAASEVQNLHQPLNVNIVNLLKKTQFFETMMN